MKGVVSIITARSRSKSVPGKNIRLLGNAPLLSYPIKAAKQSAILDRIIVSTDSERYAEIARQYGAEVPHLRPAHLAEDVPSEQVLEWEVEQLEKDGYPVDIVMLEQCTTPLVESSDIDACISVLLNRPSAQTCITVAKMGIHPFWSYNMDRDGKLSKFVKGKIQGEKGVRQFLPPCYRITGMCYAIRRDFLMNEHRILGEEIFGIETPSWRSYDIDEEDDFAVIEAFIPRYRERNG